MQGKKRYLREISAHNEHREVLVLIELQLLYRHATTHVTFVDVDQDRVIEFDCVRKRNSFYREYHPPFQHINV